MIRSCGDQVVPLNESRIRKNMEILLTNDDGLHAPGLVAMQRELQQLGNVTVVAPATEQSGVSHSITYLTPLTCQQITSPDGQPAWAVQGSPADCVKLGVFEFCPSRPDLIVSGINHGLNAGINVLYSGTVAAAVEGAFFGISSLAISLEASEQPEFEKAAQVAHQILTQVLSQQGEKPQLYNLNIPTTALTGLPEVHVVPMGINRYGEDFIKRQDPNGRDYYWATVDPPPAPHHEETDMSALAAGFISLTPLQYDMTQRQVMTAMKTWSLDIQESPT